MFVDEQGLGLLEADANKIGSSRAAVDGRGPPGNLPRVGLGLNE